MFVLNDRKILNSKRLANLGKLTLGIYAGHLLIARRLKPVDIGFVKSYWIIIYPVTVIILTSIMVLVLKRVKILSRFV